MILWAVAILLFIAILAIAFLLNFYKDPKRAIPKGSNIVAPADGKIISIIDTSKRNIKIKKGLLGKIKTYTKDVANQCYAVSIFMSPFDAHYNRAPMEGVIKSVKHTKGRFFKAYDLEKSLENEKNEIIMQNKDIKIKVIQIAGFLARRIMVKANQKVDKGQKIGFIALGSQTTIILPRNLKLKVKTGDRTKAGQTIIAVLK
ncbi:phosphatidylserine decarboxylase [Candidatus Woesearchaeota archaeon]|nr:phosphatidylserine decarboxylase [Candidatus Woesearchaeota archaeon]